MGALVTYRQGLLPSALPAPGNSACFVDPVPIGRMEGEGKAIAQRALAVSAPGLSAIKASHHRSGLDPDKDDIAGK